MPCGPAGLSQAAWLRLETSVSGCPAPDPSHCALASPGHVERPRVGVLPTTGINHLVYEEARLQKIPSPSLCPVHTPEHTRWLVEATGFWGDWLCKHINRNSRAQGRGGPGLVWIWDQRGWGL